MKKSLLFSFLIYSLCLLSACGGGSTQPHHVATHFSVAPATSTPTAGTPFNITVTALDSSGQMVASYSGTVHFTSSNGQPVLPASAMMTSGTGTFSVTLNTVGSQTITATDAATASITGTSSTINVSATVATHFSVAAPAAVTAGSAFNVTLNALDASNNVVSGYSGTVHFTSSNGQPVLPTSATMTSGTGTFPVTLNTIGSQTITATDAATASINGTSSTINVSATAVATHFSVTAPAAVTAGSAFSFTVNALDASNNVVTAYSGTVHFKSTDAQADLAPDSILMNGTAAFPAALKTPGVQTITATDTVTASITGTSNSINVSAAAAASPVPLINEPLSPDAVVPGGGAFPLTVNGTGFVSGSIVRWNGSPRTTSFTSDSQLTANILASDIAAANTALVTVVNPALGVASNAVFFETTRSTSTVSWSITSNPAAGSQPTAVATADLNGDGKEDIVVTNGGSNNISIFLGNGNGTFLAAVNYPTGTNPDSVAVGDFNGDGKLDLVVANHDSNDVSILLGNGDGTFQAAVSYPTGTNPSSVAVGDFNGDGKLDLAEENSGSRNVSILLGNGDGTFQAALDFGTGLTLGSMAVGDFNGDGKLDLVVGLVNSVSIFLGNGDGTFQPGVDYLAGSTSSSVAVGDFNGDGKLDLAVAHGASTVGSGGNVTILLGNGDGTFQAPVQYNVDSFADSSPVMGDFNGDGKLDLAVANGKSVSILLGNGDGTFQSAVDYAAGSSPLLLAVGDFNGDGRLDMAVADQSSSTVSVLLQPGLTGPNATLSPTFLTFATQLVGTTSTSESVTLSNDGTATLDITSIAATTNFSETDNCGSSLAAGTSCTMSTTFTPTAQDNVIGTLSITDNAPGSPQTVTLNGVGTVVKLVPTSMDFSCGQTCPPEPKTATLTNTGATALSISSITITSNKAGANDRGGFAQTNNCPSSLGAGQSCSITVKFVGVFNFEYIGALLVTDNGGGSPQTVSLRGSAFQ